jgi:D-alanine-D-alanine ligase
MTIHLAMPEHQSANATRHTAWERLLRRKGHLSSRAVMILTIFACVPLLTALARIVAFPGIHVPGLSLLGTVLNNWCSFEWVPHADRWAIVYILLLPTAALLITLARLTFGLRILGFRAILVAIGFQEIGILPSLLLMVLVVTTILVARPSMRRIQLPFYARIAVILCIAATIMVSGLLLGPWLGSNTLWSFAFFPVIILAMLAESIASTLARDDAWTAAWRAGWTLVLALLITFISWIPAVREVALLLPELILTQLVAIIFISEFLDFRLLEQWPARGLRLLRQRSVQKETQSRPRPGGLRVAVVQNRWNKNVIGRLGVSALVHERTQSVQVVVDALREQDFTVQVFEGDMSLLRDLHQFLPTRPLTGAPGGLVLNLAAGVQGRGRSCHVPAMLEMAGVPYTGPDPVAQACLLDRYALMMLLRQAGVCTPRVRLMASKNDDLGDLRFPLVVRPRYELAAYRTVVKHRKALDAAVEHIVRNYAQEALIEAPEKFPEIRVCLLGNEAIECLPLLQVDASGKKTCPAPIDEALAKRVVDCARTAYAKVGCRDYARIDIRLTARGRLHVVGVHAVGIFARNGSFAHSAARAGYSFGALMGRVVEVAWNRYGSAPAVLLPAEREPATPTVLLEKKVASQ